MQLQLLRIALLAGISLTAACSIGLTDTVPASVSGVNYSGNDIHYSLFDPDDPKQSTQAGEDLGPFAAGGVMCCYPVPNNWKPGVKVGVAVRTFDNKALKYLPEKTFVVELPPYDASGKAGDVWFINYPDDTVGVVSTMYRPNSELWPGKIKGWPKPSIEYQREQWELLMGLAKESLAASEEYLKQMTQDPKKYL